MNRLYTLLLIIAVAAPASTQANGSISGLTLTNNSGGGTSSGCCPSCTQTRTTLGVVSQTADSFTTRFAELIAADARLTTPISTSLISSYTLSFDVICPPGGYRITVDTNLRGAFTHVDDSSGCGVAGTASSDLSPITGAQSGGALSGNLSITDPGGLSGAGGNQYVTIDRSESAVITGTSSGSPQSHSLTFNWTGSCASNATAFTCGMECAVRLGLDVNDWSGCPTDGISADDYPGVGSRTATDDGHIVTATLECLCGNGTIDAGEQCDQGSTNGTAGSCCSPTCQLLPANTECRASAGACDPVETCDGAGGQCPADIISSAGFGCADDGNECTDDVCDGVSTDCTHPSKPVGTSCAGGTGACTGAGTCGPPLPTPSPSPTPTPISLCQAAPISGCRTPIVSQKARLIVKNKPDQFRDRLTWKWIKGADTTALDFGNPVADTNYSLCVYDETGSVPALVLSARAPAGGTCNNKPCWKEVHGGFRYSDSLVTPDGLFKILLKEGTGGRAHILVKAKGPRLVLPPPAGFEMFNQDSRVRVQLVNDAVPPVCWEASFSAPAQKNTAELFRDKAD